MHVPSRSSAIGLLLALLTGCGDGGTAPEDRIPTSIFVSNAPVAMTSVGQTVQLDVTVYDQNGQAISSAVTTFVSNVPAVATVDGVGLVTAVGHGNATVTIQSGPVSQDVQISVQLESVPLQDGEPVTLAGPVLSQQFFTLEVPAGGDRRFLEIRISGGTGDADIRVRHGQRPTVDLFDCASLNAGDYPDHLDFCAIWAPDPGTWHIQVMGVIDFAEVELVAGIVEPVELENGLAVSGLAGPTTGIHYFALDVPPAGAPVTTSVKAASGSAPGTLVIESSGGTGDADLFATDGGQFELDIITGLPCSSIRSATSDEICTLTDPADGTWLIVMLGYEAFTGVSVTATFTPPGAQ